MMESNAILTEEQFMATKGYFNMSSVDDFSGLQPDEPFSYSCKTDKTIIYGQKKEKELTLCAFESKIQTKMDLDRLTSTFTVFFNLMRNNNIKDFTFYVYQKEIICRYTEIDSIYCNIESLIVAKKEYVDYINQKKEEFYQSFQFFIKNEQKFVQYCISDMQKD